jgi:hypothetical protein
VQEGLLPLEDRAMKRPTTGVRAIPKPEEENDLEYFVEFHGAVSKTAATMPESRPHG